MGFHEFSPWSLLLILLIVIVIFGTKKIKNIGGDLGKAYRNFKDALDGKEVKKDEDENDAPKK